MAGQEAAEQVHAFGLRERCRLADHRPGQSETPGELVGHAPLQERPEGVAAMLVVLDVPGVDVVLAAGGQIEAVLLAAGGIAAYATRQHTTANQDQAS